MAKVICIGWKDNTAIRPTGRMVRRDGVNWSPEFESCAEGKALVWSRDLSRMDSAIEFAKDHEPPAFAVIMDDTPDVLDKVRERALVKL